MGEQLDLEIGEPVRRTVEAWSALKGTESHWFAAANYSCRWGFGREVSELDYDAAIAAVQTLILR